MNFKDNQTTLRDNLFKYPTRVEGKKKGKTKPAYFSGIYFISRNENDLQMKIGMSGQIYKRLLSYKVCFPYKSEFWVQYCIITPTAQDAKTLEKAILNHPELTDNVIEANPSAEGKRSLEYKILKNKADLGGIIYDVLKKPQYNNLWTHWVPFSRDGWMSNIRNTTELQRHWFLPRKRLSKKEGLYTALPT